MSAPPLPRVPSSSFRPSVIIRSLLDTDLYKFTMMQAVLHQFPGAEVEYRFKCRNEGVSLAFLADTVAAEVDCLCELRFREDELDYLRGLRYIKSDFVDFLALFRFNRKHIEVKDEGPDLSISIRGPWLHTILFEIPVLAIVNEAYFRATVPAPDYAEGRRRLAEKIALVKALPPELGFTFADYGTRRRFSHAWQRELLETLKRELPDAFVGTSNVLFAKELGLLAVGTMAHEWLQAAQALGPRLRDSQRFAFQKWADEYRGDLGIALSDVAGLKAFMRDFDMYFCKLFDGARHDSGDPKAWGDALIEHYRKNKVDPRTKLLVFSDGLTFPRAVELARYFQGRAKTAFGIGTNLTNDLGYTPLQIVIKMVRCQGQPVAKLSDTPGKTMCEDPSYLAYLRQVFEVP
ncbi:MAG: nicotinate phosphoribosyltransferase [Casimicrobiaceae bacterium]|nr:nicotinate phosphoribosyltransferase [Casimicrobiaceae bacterium]